MPGRNKRGGRVELQDIREKLKRNNKILFSRDSACLQELLQLIRQQTHRALVLWAFDCVREPIRILRERYPAEQSPEIALALCKKWAEGQIKMPAAKRAILQVHAMAKSMASPVDAALCHAVGQACAVVHVETHAIGLPIYELTALVREYGIENSKQILADKIFDYTARLRRCSADADAPARRWADFLLRDSYPNKEQLLFEKTQKTEA